MDSEIPSPTSKIDAILFGLDEKCDKFIRHDEPLAIRTKSSSESSGSNVTSCLDSQNHSPEKQQFIPSQQIANSNNVFLLDNLREQLNKAQSDHAFERANRKRKEKSLLKLATELTHRTEDKNVYETNVVELNETISDLDARLMERNRDLSRMKVLVSTLQNDLQMYAKEANTLKEQLLKSRLESAKAKGQTGKIAEDQVGYQEDQDDSDQLQTGRLQVGASNLTSSDVIPLVSETHMTTSKSNTTSPNHHIENKCFMKLHKEIEKHECDMNRIRKELQEARREARMAKTEMVDLSFRYSRKSQKIANFDNELFEKNATIDLLREKLDIAEKKNIQYEHECESNIGRFTERKNSSTMLEDDLRQFKEESEELRLQIHELRLKLTSSASQIKDLSARLSKEQLLKEARERELAQAISDIESVRQQLHAAEEVGKSSDKALAEVSNELVSSKKLLMKREEESRQTDKQSKEFLIALKTAEEKTLATEEKLASVHEEMSAMVSENASLIDERAVMCSLRKQLHQVQAESMCANADASAAKKECSLKESHCIELTNQIRQLEDDVKSLHRKAEEAGILTCTTKSELDKTLSELTLEKSKSMKLDLELRNLRKELENVHEQLHTTQLKFKSVNEELQVVSEAHLCLRQSHTNREIFFREHKAESENLGGDLWETRKLLKDIKTKLSTSPGDIEILNEAHNELNAERQLKINNIERALLQKELPRMVMENDAIKCTEKLHTLQKVAESAQTKLVTVTCILQALQSTKHDNVSVVSEELIMTHEEVTSPDDESNDHQYKKDLISLRQQLQKAKDYTMQVHAELASILEESILENDKSLKNKIEQVQPKERNSGYKEDPVATTVTLSKHLITDHAKATEQADESNKPESNPLNMSQQHFQEESGKDMANVASVLEQLASSLQDEVLSRQSVEQKSVATSATKVLRILGSIFVCLLLSNATILFIMEKDLALNIACSPIRPWTQIETGDSLKMEAPWWVLKPYKKRVFVRICHNRVRSTLDVKNGKIYISDMDSNDSTLLWTRKVAGDHLVIHPDKISLTRKGRFPNGVEEIKTPWSI